MWGSFSSSNIWLLYIALPWNSLWAAYSLLYHSNGSMRNRRTDHHWMLIINNYRITSLQLGYGGSMGHSAHWGKVQVSSSISLLSSQRAIIQVQCICRQIWEQIEIKQNMTINSSDDKWSMKPYWFIGSCIGWAGLFDVCRQQVQKVHYRHIESKPTVVV